MSIIKKISLLAGIVVAAVIKKILGSIKYQGCQLSAQLCLASTASRQVKAFASQYGNLGAGQGIPTDNLVRDIFQVKGFRVPGFHEVFR